MKNVLLYKAPAACFEEALPLGNGSLGAMVYGGTDADIISLNHDTLWSGGPKRTVLTTAKGAYENARQYVLDGKIDEAEELITEDFNADRSQKYVPMGNLRIKNRAVPDSEGYVRTLDMKNALVNVNFKNHCREYFCSNPDDVLAIKYKDNKPQNYEISFDSPIKHSVLYSDDKIVISGECPSGHMPYVTADEPCPYDGSGIKFTTIIRIVSDGTTRAENGGLCINKACKTYIYVCVVTSFIDYNTLPIAKTQDVCEEKIKKVLFAGYENIKHRHTEDFSAFYIRTDINLSEDDNTPTDELLKLKSNYPYMAENMFSFAKYLMISSSREGSEAMNLQGIWNDMLFAPWNSSYTLDINTEMNYWPALSFDLCEMKQPFVCLAEKLADTGGTTAKGHYGASGSVSHAFTDLWGTSTSSGRKSRKSCRYAFWNMSLVWLANEIYHIFEYTNDICYLKERIYPLLKKSVEFCLDCLVDLDGKKVMLMSTSPENAYVFNGERVGLAKYTAMTQQLITVLFSNYVKCCELLKIDFKKAEKLKEIIPKLDTFDVGSKGQLLEWDSEYTEDDPQHRHISHLWGVYPGVLFTEKSNKRLYDASKKSLKIRGDGCTGWSIAWKMNLWARFKEGNHSFEVFKKFMTFSQPVDHSFYKNTAPAVGVTGGVFPNLFDSHPPFQIDGNFGAAMAIIQWFVQCEGGVVKILPALPDELPCGTVKGLKVVGNIKIDIKWRNKRCVEFAAVSPFSQNVVFNINSEDVLVFLEENKRYTYFSDNLK